MTDASGTTRYYYDEQGRMERKETPQGTLIYEHDAAGNLLSMTSTNTGGASVTYEYDDLNRLENVIEDHLGETNYGYTDVGNLENVQYPNGVQHIYGFDAANRLKQVTLMGATAAVLADYTYSINAAGHRTQVTEHSGRTVAYTYDALNRLKTETIAADPDGINGQSGWQYGETGNRLSQSSTIAGVASQSFTYDSNDRLDHHTYDAQGNTTAAEGSIYTWDHENMLVSKTGGSEGDVTLVYNGDGQLVEKTSGGVTTQYLVDDLNPTGYSQVVEELVGGQVQTVYTYGHDLISQDRRDGAGNTWAVSFYGYDGHGSVRLLTDATGAVTDSYTYDAWGKALTLNGSTPNRYLYAGERWISELALSYNRARMLSTAHGRFWSMDAWEGMSDTPMSLNKYLYGSANPTGRIDPSGYSDFTLAGLNNTVGIIGSIAVLSVSVNDRLRQDLVDASSGFAAEVLSRPLGLAHAGALQAQAVDMAFYSTNILLQISRAMQKLKKLKMRYCMSFKFVVMPRLVIPEVTYHISDAIASGHPAWLIRADSSRARANRASAISGRGSAGSRGTTPLSWDEYPFASSFQGGTGASVRAVPLHENRVQGGLIGAQYQMQAISVGECYWVVPL